MATHPDTPKRDQRLAAVCSVLSRAVASGEVDRVDALRIIKHELRTRNTNRALKAPHRSRGAQEVIDAYRARGESVPKNSSPDALHSDHVFPLSADELLQRTTVEDWLVALAQLDLVVCVTAAENYRLEQVERDGHQGWAKYAEAGVEVLGLI